MPISTPPSYDAVDTAYIEAKEALETARSKVRELAHAIDRHATEVQYGTDDQDPIVGMAAQRGERASRYVLDIWYNQLNTMAFDVGDPVRLYTETLSTITYYRTQLDRE